jgi:putative oxidoreductase
MNFASLIEKADDLARKIFGSVEFIPGILTRLLTGFAFYDSGSGKLSNMENTINFFITLEIPFPELNAAFVARLEYYGGMLLIAGVATRVVAALLSSTMVVALLTADRETFVGALLRRANEDGTAGIGLSDVPPFVLLVFLLWLIVRGPGVLSVDFFLGKLLRKKAVEPTPQER